MTLPGRSTDDFIRDGFVSVDDAFPRAVADEARAVFWNDLRTQGPRPWGNSYHTKSPLVAGRSSLVEYG
jgi:hypothetical protein